MQVVLRKPCAGDYGSSNSGSSLDLTYMKDGFNELSQTKLQNAYSQIPNLAVEESFEVKIILLEPDVESKGFDLLIGGIIMIFDRYCPDLSPNPKSSWKSWVKWRGIKNFGPKDFYRNERGLVWKF